MQCRMKDKQEEMFQIAGINKLMLWNRTKPNELISLMEDRTCT